MKFRLDRSHPIAIIPRVFANRISARAAHFPVVLALVGIASVSLAIPAIAAVTFDSAQVSRLENQVEVGERESGARRTARIDDTVRQNNFVVTENKSRAELKFSDNSIVRVGQNSVFTFDGSRTLELKKGAMLIYVPPGAGGGTIKTPSVTAAITGTLALVTPNLFAITKGSLTLPDGVVVPQGSAVIFYPGGGYRVFEFEQESVANSALVRMGPLDESPFALEKWLGPNTLDELLRLTEVQRIVQADPRVRAPKPEKKEEKKEEKKKKEKKSEESPYMGGF